MAKLRTIVDRDIGETFEVPVAGETCVGYTPAGREIRLTAAGKFIAQPPHDNYWIECDTYSQACDAAGCGDA